MIGKGSLFEVLRGQNHLCEGRDFDKNDFPGGDNDQNFANLGVDD